MSTNWRIPMNIFQSTAYNRMKSLILTFINERIGQYKFISHEDLKKYIKHKYN